jgi:iron complex outermembrane receptor protein
MSRVRTFLAAFVAALLLVVPTSAQAQTGNVAGRVFDASNMRPLEGVQVEVAGRGGISGADGRFLITNIPVGPQTVRATIIGYATSETTVTVTAGQTTVLDFQLTLEALSLEGIVVTGYGQQEARDLTGVIEAVQAEEFNTGPVVAPEELIQGKVAGVQVITPGFRGGVNIRIRGGTSINASNEPLFVIDGVPVAVGGGLSAGSNPLSFLNPDDIETITVLKDASAAAIYGSRGANGVILIETKGGRAGAEMTYTGTVSASSVIGDLELVGADDFRAAVQQYAPSNAGALLNANTDWRDAIMRTAYGQEHSLTVTGGTDQSNYRISFGYNSRDGVVEGSDTERVTGSLNFNQLLLNDRLSVEANVKGSRVVDNFSGGAIGNATGFAPTQPILDPNNPNQYYEWNASAGLSPENPFPELENIENEGTAYRSLGGLQLQLDLPWVTGLQATSNLGYDVTKTENIYFAPSFLKAQEGSNPGSVSRSNNTDLKVLFDAYLNYKRPIGDNNDLEFTGGYSYENARAEFPSFYAAGLSADFLGSSGIPDANELGANLFVDESRLISFFGRLNYSIADKYLFTGSIRRDGSSKFGPEEEWGIFPSAAFAWRAIEEDFLADSDLFSDLKFRVSWGVTGNQAFASYQQYSSYLISDQFARVQFGDRFVTTIRPSAADPGIKWEETTSYNIGADFGLFDNRITGSLEYYFKNTDDLIFTVPVAAGTNLSDFVTTNIGSLENQGIELSLSAALIEAQDDGGFGWDASFNLAYNKNELTQINAVGAGDEQILVGGIAGGVGNTIQVLQPGSPVNSFHTYRHIIGADGKPIWADTNGDGNINEQDLYVDVNGDGTINQDDRQANESPAPDFIIGHSSYMTMGQFDLSYSMRAYLGNHVYNNIASDAGHYNRLVGAVPYSLHASVLANGFESPQYFSDIYIEDASFLRLDNITLGYTVDGMGMLDGARLFATIQNVFTLTGYSGIDPEALIGGIDNNLYPRSRTFSVGMTLGF